jgi:hypothetical protein
VNTISVLQEIFNQKRLFLINPEFKGGKDREIYEKEKFFNYYLFDVILPFLTDLFEEGHIHDFCLMIAKLEKEERQMQEGKDTNKALNEDEVDNIINTELQEGNLDDEEGNLNAEQQNEEEEAIEEDEFNLDNSEFVQYPLLLYRLKK